MEDKRICDVYYMNVRLGMKQYDFVGTLPILDAAALHKVCKKGQMRGVFWKFVLPDGNEFHGC